METLSPRARAWLERVGAERRPERATVAEFPSLDPALLEAALRFEDRWGGFRIDRVRENLELGIGLLLARGLRPDSLEDPPRLLVGTGENADLWLDPRGRVWLSGPDRELGLFASSMEKHLERLASREDLPWTSPPFLLHGSPQGAALAGLLALKPDADVSDDTFLRADSPRHSLQAALQGTAYRRSFLSLKCRDFDAMADALRIAAAGLPGWTASVVPAPPHFVESRVDASQAPDRRALEATLASASTLRIPSADGGAIHLFADPPRLEAYALGEDGAVECTIRGGPVGGTVTSFVPPWPGVK